MGKINWGRVVLGGVVSFLVFNALWAFWFPYAVNDYRAAFGALNRPFQLTPALFAVVLALTLVGGIVSIWFYAAIRPRYGPGPKTAAGAGFALWLIGNLVPTLWWGWQLQFPARMLALDVVAHLVAIVAATIAGAWPYKE